MAQMNQRVRFQGLLRGNGREATCTVSAVRVTLPGTGMFQHVDWRIERVSKALPEGTYELHANGEVTPLRFTNGHWLAVT